MSVCIHTIYIASSSTNEILTQSSSHLITEMARSCKTKVLEVFSPVLLLDDVVCLKNQLIQLIFYIEKSQTATKSFMPVCLRDDKIPQVLNMYEKQSSESSVETFAEALKHNNVNECSFVQIKWITLRWLVARGTLKGIATLLHSFYAILNKEETVIKFW